MTISNTLSSREFNRYSQQMNLPEIGVTGQIKLKQAKVLCVGAGGLGTPLLLYLAASGVGTLGIVDEDIVECDNLHRQVLYDDEDIGLSKVECARLKLQKQNSHIQVQVHHTKIESHNAADILSQYDIVADCSDNFATRYLLNTLCVQLQKPLVSASVSRFQGQCMTFAGKEGPCLQCLFPDMPAANEIQNCAESGVLNVLPGLLGVLQATEILKWILQIGTLLSGRVLMVDVLTMRFHEYILPKNPDCSLCAQYRMIDSLENTRNDLRSSTAMNEYLISPVELNDMLKNNKDIELVDVRTIEKHIHFNIGGKHIPTAELPSRVNELDSSKMVVTYCTSGGNSMRALQYLLSVGFKSVKSLDGGMTAWQTEIK